MTKKVKVAVKQDVFRLVAECVEYAAERACNRHDKYSETALSQNSRELLCREFEASFWLAVDDHCIEFIA